MITQMDRMNLLMSLEVFMYIVYTGMQLYAVKQCSTITVFDR